MLRAAAILAAALSAGAASADVLSARYLEPTDRYNHGVLGDAIEYGALEIRFDNSTSTPRRGTALVRLPSDHVFEDTAPRLADVDGDGDREVIVVETDVRQGAALAIYDETGKLAETPHIGQARRWLAPLGAADLDGDGLVELAYIDRPHLAKTLRIWRYQNGQLTPVADQPRLTNHRIGQDYISGGIRDCGGGPEIITANADWTLVMASRLANGGITTRALGPFNNRTSLTDALACKG